MRGAASRTLRRAAAAPWASLLEGSVRRGLSGRPQFARGAGESASLLGRQPWLVAVAAGLSAGLGLALYPTDAQQAQCKAAAAGGHTFPLCSFHAFPAKLGRKEQGALVALSPSVTSCWRMARAACTFDHSQLHGLRCRRGGEAAGVQQGGGGQAPQP